MDKISSKALQAYTERQSDKKHEKQLSANWCQFDVHFIRYRFLRSLATLGFTQSDHWWRQYMV